jgi:hypothetical protein
MVSRGSSITLPYLLLGLSRLSTGCYSTDQAQVGTNDSLTSGSYVIEFRARKPPPSWARIAARMSTKTRGYLRACLHEYRKVIVGLTRVTLIIIVDKPFVVTLHAQIWPVLATWSNQNTTIYVFFITGKYRFCKTKYDQNTMGVPHVPQNLHGILRHLSSN